MFDEFYFDQVPFDWFIIIPPPTLETRLLHVRHPALLTVSQKRGGILIKGYDTLSSLDEQYLTGQVGLDVQPGDEVEVTTIAGNKSTYQVP